MENLNFVLSTRENIRILIDEIEALSKELIIQTLNSNKSQKSTGDNTLAELTKILVQKQSELTIYLKTANEQQILFDKISKVKSTLVESDSDIKNLLLYMKEAEQVLSSAVYQSRIKLDMIAKAKPISSDLIIKYAHKISTDFGVCCPENWTPDNQRRPYPTDSDMRKGWLGKINDLCTIPALDEDEAQRASLKANSKVIDPIVPQEFGFNKEKLGNSMTEFMSDMSSESSNDSDNMI